MTNILNTRAVLMLAPAFAEADTDPNGNPIVWVNRYSCRTCPSEQIDWCKNWSSICDDDCPNCGNTQSPYESVWMGPKEPPFRRIWELLPEAGNDNRTKTAAEVKKLIDKMDSDPDFSDIPKRPGPMLQTAAYIREMEANEKKEAQVSFSMDKGSDDGSFYTMVGSEEYKRAQAIINGDMSRRLMAAASTDYVAFDPKKTNIKDVVLNARQLGKTETVLKAEKMLDFCNEITQRAAPAWAWDMIDGLLGLGLGDDADLSAVAMKFATENQEYAELTREDAKRAMGRL